jgi:hypothetical protein
MKHKYVDEFTLAGALGVMGNYRFRATGMFDPNHTAGGHQPAYFDILNQVYDYWIVNSSTIEIMVVPNGAGIIPLAVGIALNDDLTTVPTSFTAYEESTLVKVNYLVPEAARPAVINLDYSMNRSFPTGNHRGLWGTSAADPVEEMVFNVFLQSVDLTSSASAFIVAKVIYDVTWFKLRDLVTS